MSPIKASTWLVGSERALSIEADAAVLPAFLELRIGPCMPVPPRDAGP